MSLREKRLLLTAGVIFFLSFSLFGLQFLMANNFFQPTKRILLSDMKKQEILTRTRELRTKLEPWAAKHQDLLRKMLRSKEKDVTALSQIWRMSPIVLFSSDRSDLSRKISFSDINRPVMYDMLCGSDVFQSRTRYRTPLTKQEVKDLADGKEILTKKKSFYWRRFRDVALITSVNPGSEVFTLWVSGRITVQVVPESVGMMMKQTDSSVREEVSTYKEVEPPFDFLR